MTIQHSGNTCDLDELGNYGEIEIFFKDGKIVHHHDYSDGVMELSYVETLLEKIGLNVTFKYVEPTPKQIKEIKTYLKKIYG
jgi:hypothetical protein